MNEVENPLGVMMGFVLQDGWTPLVIASQEGHLEIVKSLIEAGANVNHTTKVVKIKHHYLGSYIFTHGFRFISMNDFLVQVCVDCDVGR